MPDKCCVPLCCSNYEKKANKKNINTDIVSVYKFPKSENERSAWVKSIPRVNLNVTKHTVVCRKHWPEDAPFYVVPGGRKRPVDPPSIFPNIPTSILITTTKTKERPTQNSLSSQRSVKNDELEEFRKKDTIIYSNLVNEAQEKYKFLQC